MSRAVMQQALDTLVKLAEQSDCDIDPFTFKRFGGRVAIDALRKELENGDGWQPIGSVPNDMSARLYRVKGFCVQGFVDATGVLYAQNDRQIWRKMAGKPTHWMPLPASPSD